MKTERQKLDFSEIVANLSNSGFTKHLKNKLVDHHKVYPHADLKPVGDPMEFLVKQCFAKSGMSCEKTTAHTVGTDLILEGIDHSLNISMKSGKMEKGSLVLSSFRTSSHNSLVDKLKYCQENLNKDDVIISVLTQEVKEGIRYQILAINPKGLKLSNLKWAEGLNSKGKQNYIGEGSFDAKFVESMSGQLWLSLPMNFTREIDDFIISF